MFNNISSEDAYWYCIEIEDIKEMRDKLVDKQAYDYCEEIDDNPEVRGQISGEYLDTLTLREMEYEDDYNDE